MTRPQEDLLVTQSQVSSRSHYVPGSGRKCSGNQADDAPKVLGGMTHIEECLLGVALGFAEAFNGKISCIAGGDPRTQERNQ